MSLNRDQFAVVLARLRAGFREGGWVDGEPLTVNDLATALGVSATPVREALSRLAGEGLVEDHRGKGYYARRIDGVELKDLYHAQEILACAALQFASRGAAAPADRAPLPRADFLADAVRAWEVFFEGLLRIANSNVLMSEQRRLADRLAPARRLEPQILDETTADFEPLAAAWGQSDWSGLATALAPLFGRRRDAAEQIVLRMRVDATRYNLSI